LLIIDVSAGEGWEQLCPFVERPMPERPFPKANVTQITWVKIEDVASVARLGGAELMRWFPNRPSDSAAHRVSPSILRSWFESMAQVATRQSVAEAGATAADKAIVRGLASLTPRIPVLSRVRRLQPYAERREWNHVWIIDPLDGEAEFARGDNLFSVNIALIEDGKPIYGVVCAPARDMTYRGRVGQGAHRCVSDAAPMRLASRADRKAAGPVQHSPAERASRALALCQAIETGGDLVLHGSMEWHTAAAEAIVRATGASMRELGSNDQPGYNKPELENPPLRIG
jgi:3'(2'), 5'-bisphosphate nucleotidase